MKLNTYLIFICVIFLLLSINKVRAEEPTHIVTLTIIFTVIHPGAVLTYHYPEPIRDVTECLELATDIQRQLLTVNSTIRSIGCDRVRLIKQ